MRRRTRLSCLVAVTALAVPAIAEFSLMPASKPIRIKPAHGGGGHGAPVTADTRWNPQFCSHGLCRIKWNLVAEDLSAAGFVWRFYPKSVNHSVRRAIDVGPATGPFDGSRWQLRVHSTEDGSDVAMELRAPVQTSFVQTAEEKRLGDKPPGLVDYTIKAQVEWNHRFRNYHIARMDFDMGDLNLYIMVPLTDYIREGGRGWFRALLQKWRTSLATLPEFIRDRDPKALAPIGTGAGAH